MRFRFLLVAFLSLAIGAAAAQQDAGPPPNGPGPAGPRGGRMGGMMGPGRGVMGTVTQVAADHFIVKNAAGESYTVHFSANTRIMKQPPRPAGANGQERGMGPGSNPPQPIKASDIKVGDAIGAGGEVDEANKSIGAMFILLLDPERAKQMREMEANFGKTWLAGRVTAINETKVTLYSSVDNASHTFVADENTSFRKRRDPITLAEVQAGDNVRVEGAVKDGQFVATQVSVMGMPQARGGPVPRPEGEPPK